MAKSNEQLEDILDDLSVIKTIMSQQNRDLVISKSIGEVGSERGGRTNNACCKHLSSLLSL